MSHSASWRTIGVPRKRLSMPTWISCGRRANSRSKPAAKLSIVSPGRPTIRSAWTWTPVSFAASGGSPRSRSLSCRRLMQLLDFGVERLDADLELQGAGRELRDRRPQRFGQAIGDHLEMEEQIRAVCRSRKNCKIARLVWMFRLNVRSTNLNCRTPRSSRVRHRREETTPAGIADRHVERRETELAAERAAARGLDVDDAMGHILVGVEVVRQPQIAEGPAHRRERRFRAAAVPRASACRAAGNSRSASPVTVKSARRTISCLSCS